LDRHGEIWLVNSDGTIGRKQATLATGTVAATGISGSIVPAGALLGVGSGVNATYQVTAQVIVGSGPTEVPVTALEAGTVGNLDPEDVMGFLVPPSGVDGTVTVVIMDGGADTETDDELRARILRRIQQPPMGGDAADFENWALAVPGVTRAWCYPLEMGIGTVTVRFMCDDLRAEFGGFPLPIDVQNVSDYINVKRPVAVKDCFIEAPLPMPIDMVIFNLSEDTDSMRAAIEVALENMLFQKAIPGGTIYRSWVEAAIQSAVGTATYELTFTTLVMPAPGYLGVLGTINYAG
jgi:uncharacterized phage protein gp47/JayE